MMEEKPNTSTKVLFRQVEFYPQAEDGEICRDQILDGETRWICTRSLGHDGPHVAHYESYIGDWDCAGVIWTSVYTP